MRPPSDKPEKKDKEKKDKILFSDLDDLRKWDADLSEWDKNALADLEELGKWDADLSELNKTALADLEELGKWDAGLSELSKTMLADLDDLAKGIIDPIGSEPSFFRSETSLESEMFDIPDPDPNAIATDVAEWMLKQVEKNQTLYQYQAVWSIREYFGDKFVCVNKNGNPAIQTDVLEAFRKISSTTVVWSRRYRFWRLREIGDEPGRLIRD